MTHPLGPGGAPDPGPVPHLLSLPHHDGGALHVPDGVPALGDTVPVRVRVPAGWGEDGVQLRVVHDGEPFHHVARFDREVAGERWYVADLRVHNPVVPYRFAVTRPDGYVWVNGEGVHARDVSDAADFRMSVHGGAPRWARDRVVYQIFPDRFARSGARYDVPDWAVPADWDDTAVGSGPLTPVQYFGGDLPGIERHLDHLVDLGVGTVYLTPFFPGRSIHRYDATTFDAVDPLLGGDAALASLSAALHARGLRLVGDLTTNHTGSGHEWFRRAQADPAAPERDFYYWRDEAPGYVGWYDIPSLPKLDYGAPGLMERMVSGPGSVAARWMAPPFSLDGWRVDVAGMTGRYGAADHTHAVARAMRATMARYADEPLLIAEHCHDAWADLAGDGWQGTMNYSGFMRPVWTWLVERGTEVDFLGMRNMVPRRPGTAVAATMREFAATVSWPVQLSQWNSLDTHDTPRFPTVTGDPVAARLGAALLFTYPGTPQMFAGAELGATGRNGEWGRIPMPWDRPERWDRETFQAYRSLIHLRNDTPALREGGMRWAVVHEDAIAYLRETPDERVLVLVARAAWPGSVLPAWLLAPGERPQNLYGGADLPVTDRGLELPGDGPTAQVWRLA